MLQHAMIVNCWIDGVETFSIEVAINSRDAEVG
jgi:hypothetical protein